MYGDKEVGLGVIGDVGTLVELNELIGLACIDHGDALAVLLNEFAKLEYYVEVDILLFGVGAECSRVFPSMSGIEHYDEGVCVQTDEQAESQAPA